MKRRLVILIACLGLTSPSGAATSISRPGELLTHSPLPYVREVCNDGVDNDGDGKIDYEDPGCAPAGTVYFVSSSTGNDIWDGLAPTYGGGHGPKQTETAIKELLNHAGPGDAILLKRGDTWNLSGTLEITDAAGDAGNPVFFGAYGSGSAPRLSNNLDAKGTITLNIHASAKNASQYLILENFVISSAFPGNEGIKVGREGDQLKPHHITIRRCTIEGNDTGVSIIDYLSDPGVTSDVTVEDCLIRNNVVASAAKEDRSLGLYCAADNLILRRNTFDNNGYIDNAFSWHAYLQCRANAIVEDNTFQNGRDGLKLGRMAGALIRGNIFDGIRFVAMTVGGDEGGASTDIIIERNHFDNCGDALVVKEQNLAGQGSTETLFVFNNFFYDNGATVDDGNDTYVSLSATTPIKNAFIYNNVFYNIQGEIDLFLGNNPASSVAVKNNIFWKKDTTAALLSNLSAADIGFNLFCIPSKDGLSYTSDDIFAEPDDLEFAAASSGNFHLSKGSELAMNQGDNAAGIVDDDYDGVARPLGTKWDIGAFEFEQTDLAISVAPPYSTVITRGPSFTKYERLTFVVTILNIHAAVASPEALLKVDYSVVSPHGALGSNSTITQNIIESVPGLRPGKSYETTYTVDIPLNSGRPILGKTLATLWVSGIPDSDWSNNSVNVSY